VVADSRCAKRRHSEVADQRCKRFAYDRMTERSPTPRTRRRLPALEMPSVSTRRVTQREVLDGEERVSTGTQVAEESVPASVSRRLAHPTPYPIR
jgi:hypothetical protein